MKNPNIDVQNVPAIIPYLIVSDVAQAVRFYQEAFGLTLSGEPHMEDGEPIFAAMTYQNSMIMIGKMGALKAPKNTPKTLNADPPVQLHLCVEQADSAFKHALQVGAIEVYPPEDKFWGERVGKVKDLDGHFWCLAEKL